MKITLTNTGKRFNREWIFRGINFEFTSPKKYAITGAYGSGKSTLIQVIAGAITHSEGAINVDLEHPFNTNDKSISNLQSAICNLQSAISNKQSANSNDQENTTHENIFQHISIAAPYLELIEEMTAIEFLNFHTNFKPFTISIAEALQIVNLTNAANKEIRYYSSGMKQRLKLAQAFFCKSPILLLDEPTTNLDAEGIALYQLLIKDYSNNKLVIISSNDKQEYSFCDTIIAIGNFK